MVGVLITSTSFVLAESTQDNSLRDIFDRGSIIGFESPNFGNIITMKSSYLSRVSEKAILNSITRNNFVPNSPTRINQAFGPLSIASNDDFSKLGFSGYGNSTDPYLIKKFVIRSNFSPLIEIYDTTAYFIIRLNQLDGENGNFPGIYLENVIHAQISQNVIQHTNTGVFFNQTTNSSIVNNVIANNTEFSIVVTNSLNNMIKINEISNNGLSVSGIAGKSELK